MSCFKGERVFPLLSADEIDQSIDRAMALCHAEPVSLVYVLVGGEDARCLVRLWAGHLSDLLPQFPIKQDRQSQGGSEAETGKRRDLPTTLKECKTTNAGSSCLRTPDRLNGA